MHFPFALVLQLFDELAVRGHYIYQSAGGPGKGKQAGNTNDGADVPPMRSKVNIPIPERGIRIGTEVDRVVSAHNQTRVSKEERPDHDFYNMQREHEEHGPTEQERSSDKMRPL